LVIRAEHLFDTFNHIVQTGLNDRDDGQSKRVCESFAGNVCLDLRIWFRVAALAKASVPLDRASDSVLPLRHQLSNGGAGIVPKAMGWRLHTMSRRPMGFCDESLSASAGH
jgi:hypothetical protein